MNAEERLKKILQIIDELRERSEEGWVILVEGERDVRALRELDITGTVVAISQIRDSDVVDKYSNHTGIIIMTDWDRKGILIEKNMVKKFSSWGIVPETRIKRKLGALVSGEINGIENLTTLISNLKLEVRENKSRYVYE